MKTNTILLILTITIVLWSNIVHAQPEVAMIYIYDNQRGESFADIFATSDSGYVMCGSSFEIGGDPDSTSQMLIVKIDDNGNHLWSNLYGVDGAGDFLSSIIETDSTDFLAVGESNDNVAAILVDNEGEEIWLETYREGHGYAVIELKSGEFVLAGTSNRSGYLACIE